MSPKYAIRSAPQNIPPQLFYEAVERAYAAILITDLEYNVLYANPTFKRITNNIVNTEIQKKQKKNPSILPASMFLDAIKKSLGDKWEQLRTHDSQFIDQEVCFNPGGYYHPRWFVCSGTWFQKKQKNQAEAQIESNQQAYFLLVAKEITNIKRQQEEVRLNVLRALLAEEELTEGMRETLAGAVHQLQVPINMISAVLGMLKYHDKNNLYTALQETLESVNKTVDHLRQCIPISDNVSESLTQVNLNDLISDVLMISTQRLLAEGIMVDWQPALVLPSLFGNIGRLRSMFKQLIDNSIDSMSDIQGLRELRLLTRSEMDLITVIIEDTGKGIPKDLRFKIFEPFFTTKKAGKGVGMGLAAVQDIINRQAGTIRIDPDYTQGSRFIIQFPTAHYRN